MDLTNLLAISLGAILVNNFILVQFLGICPFMGVSKKMDTAVGMGFAVIFVMGIASAFCYVVNLLLVYLDLEFMQTVAFILVIAALVQLWRCSSRRPCPASTRPGRVPAPHHHQLRGAGRGPAQRAGGLQLY